MALTLADVARSLEELAPRGLAEPWDRPGLQVGDPRSRVRAVLVALDPSPGALAEARRRKAQLLVTHHPLLLEPLPRLDLSAPLPGLVAEFLRAEIGVYAAHTNLDRAEGGVNDALAECLALRQVVPLGRGEPLCKIVVTVPLGYEEPVRRALAAAGAGRVGRYTGCSFSSRGEGVFIPGEGAAPFLGAVGREERVAETRLEAVVSRSLAGRAAAEVRHAHPYEEPALDLYALEGLTGNGGLGRCGTLREARRLGEWAGEVARRLGATAARLVGEPRMLVERVAVCGGSGASLWPEALAAGAQVLVTGDVKYHGALEARQAGLALLDIGHGPSERLAVDVLAEHLASWAKGTGERLQVHRLWEADPFLAVEMRGAPGERPVEDHLEGA